MAKQLIIPAEPFHETGNAYPKLSFVEFLFIWNCAQGLTTPILHRKIAQWLNDCWLNGDRRLLLMAFRAAGKSTLVGIFIVFLLWQRPDLRILILSAEQDLANRMVRTVRRIIERHPLSFALKPDKAEEWAADRLTINRIAAHRDSSLLARGIEANMTGSRADIVILDDVEVPNNCDSALKREALRTRLTEVDYILVPGGTQLYIGTPHSFYSIYADRPRVEIGEETIFLDGFKRLKLPIITPKGQPQWPERFNNDTIEAIKKRHGPAKFTSQMLLEPISEHSLRLDPERMIPYKEELRYHEGNHETSLWLGDIRLVAASCMWDPAYGDPFSGSSGTKSGDDSTVAVVYCDDEGRYYIHRVLVLKVDDSKSLDPARQQCQQVAEFLNQYYIPCVRVEGNGIGRFLPRLLGNVLSEMKIEANIVTTMNRQSKVKRILNAFDAPLAAGQVFASTQVLTGPLSLQMSEWRADGLGRGSQHDDALDAVAGAILAEPIRLPRHFSEASSAYRTNRPRPTWQKHAHQTTAKQNFNPYSF